MSGPQGQERAPASRKPERIPLGQAVFDQIFLLFMLSLVLSFVLYNLWGLMELLNLPIAPY